MGRTRAAEFPCRPGGAYADGVQMYAVRCGCRNFQHDMRLNTGYTRIQLSQPIRKVQRTGKGAGQMLNDLWQMLRSVPAGAVISARAEPLYSGRIQSDETHIIGL